ncbi:hypothetical protein B7463_g3729, partial [Scytalidium lignicola]
MADIPVSLQAAIDSPFKNTPGKGTRSITIYHSHLPEGRIRIVSLIAPDLPDGGLQYEFVIIACGILTGNKWDGYLTATKDGPQIQKEPKSVLYYGSYFFHLETSTIDAPYEIVKSFHDWAFPHGDLPGSWASFTLVQSLGGPLAGSSLATALQYSDQTCRVTGYLTGAQVAHIIPKKEIAWYRQNDMIRPHQERNGLNVFHATKKCIEYIQLNHNRQVQGLLEVSTEFLFARLAWTIFPFLGNDVDHDQAEDESMTIESTNSSGGSREESPESDEDECAFSLPQPIVIKSRVIKKHCNFSAVEEDNLPSFPRGTRTEAAAQLSKYRPSSDFKDITDLYASPSRLPNLAPPNGQLVFTVLYYGTVSHADNAAMV